MQIIVDRIENDMVVCEDQEKSFFNIPLSSFGFSVKDGDVCEYDGNTAILLEVETLNRKELLQNRFNRLKKYSDK